MPSRAFLSHADLDKVLARLQLGVDASEMHGAVLGYLCVGGEVSANEDWLQALQLKTEHAHSADLAQRLLAELAAQGRERLDDPGLTFMPMLPADDRAVAERARALIEWCRGFLGGLGLAGLERTLAPAATEVVRDIERLAASRDSFEGNDHEGEDDEGEDDEAALTELIEFVRVGVLLLYAELRAPPVPGTPLQ